jgi:hypothetical protein
MEIFGAKFRSSSAQLSSSELVIQKERRATEAYGRFYNFIKEMVPTLLPDLLPDLWLIICDYVVLTQQMCHQKCGRELITISPYSDFSSNSILVEAHTELTAATIEAHGGNSVVAVITKNDVRVCIMHCCVESNLYCYRRI